MVWLIILAFLNGVSASAQTLNLPARATNAPGGAAFKKLIEPLTVPYFSAPNHLRAREIAIYGQVLQGNVPNWMRPMTLVSTNAIINGTNHTVSYYVAPDYFAIGSEQDYFLTPMTPLLAQRVADALGCSLPTAKMVNDIWKKAPCHLAPAPIPYSAQMVTVPVFDDHNTTVRGQRFAVTNTYPLGTLTGGDNKDVVIANKIYSNFDEASTNVVVIYGWHYLDGSHIQNVYNGHEETYADYSHGIRMVQMNLTVDGQASTVTNVLTNSNFAGLLSDDTIFSNSRIPIPRYKLIAMPPAITVHPVNQTVVSNATVSFSAFAVGENTLAYQWKFNGTNLSGETTSTLTIPNIQATNVGTYTVVVTNSAGTATSIPALLKIKNPVHPILFADDFETNSASRWNLSWGAGDGVADYTVDWAFDYSHEATTFNGAGYFIPSAPNSTGTATRGVRLTVNNNDATGVIAGVNLYPKNKIFSNDYALKFDMWINYPGGVSGAGGSGSTEYALCGLNHLGTQANWAATSSSSTDGLWFAVDGEGGGSPDYRAFVGNIAGTQSELTGTPSGLSQSDSTAAFYQTVFPTSRHETSGAPGKNWVEVELRQTNGVVIWLMNGTVVAQRTNSSSFTSGTAMIGFMDTFTSIASPASQAFILFDNVRVEDLVQSLQPPAITTPPQNIQTNVGTNVTFNVTATGSAPLLYQWLFNNVAIASATNSTLQLLDVQSTNIGSYTVTVSNPAGSASASAELTVISQLPRFESIARNATGPTQVTFTGNNGSSYLLEASTNLIWWKPISVLAISNGPFPFLDLESTNLASRFYRSHSSSSILLADFEAYANGASVLFQRPTTSGSTTNFLDLAATDFAYVTNVFPGGHTSTKVLTANWTFKTFTSNSWLRFTTFNTANIPNPIISSNQAVQFQIYSDRDIYVTLGLRETNPTGAIGSDGGTGGTGNIEWVGGSTANTNPPKGRFVPAGQWTIITIFMPYEPVRGFTGNGILETATGKLVLEHLALVPLTSGVHNVYLDDFRLIDLTP
ncbi:MAG: Immunoglobulin I-set domain protein [Verrucomicrobiales bacterium]|nr:Immunoglobulin I-set domain protein [Verrucomicrobiales bacterium]